ncbi:MAG: hypothetical protein RR898_01465 [Clostridium sp.]|uniref:hypothetical protein n=1 Tax=Clostridium sp. TaxID=1506 RepID=UPI002FC73B2A
MKIEIGESLLLSWLKHIKECQIVQTNWKVSNKWEMKNIDTLEEVMNESSKFFNDKYGYNLYKGNSGISQVLSQSEVDVLGVNFNGDEKHIYAIDVAFHEAGLNYGSREETVARVIKKCIRAAMCIYGCFDINYGTVIFTSPKINPAVMNDINNCIDNIEYVLREKGLDFKVRVIANEDFSDKILEPILNTLGDVADTSELFMRSLQMYNMFADKRKTRVAKALEPRSTAKVSNRLEAIEYTGIDGLDEMKIGVIVRTVFRRMLESGQVSREEIELMQTKDYSKETFDIQYPLLQRASLTNYKSPRRYYSGAIKVYDEEYFLCSEWYEVDANNDRPYLLKWLALHN